jgi:hypothetical protein
MRTIARAVRDLRAASRSHEGLVGRLSEGRYIGPPRMAGEREQWPADDVHALPVEIYAGAVTVLEQASKGAAVSSESGIDLQAIMVVGASKREATPVVEVLVGGVSVGRLAESDAEHLVMHTQTPLDGGTYNTTATLRANATSLPPYALTVAGPRVRR